MINDEMQPWAQVTGSVCRWKNTKAAGRMNLLTSRREETGVQFVCERRRRNLACADVYHKYSTAHPHILRDFSLHSFLSSLSCVQFLFLHLILDSTLHSPSLSPLFLPRPHYLFLLFTHTSQPPLPFLQSPRTAWPRLPPAAGSLVLLRHVTLLPSLPFGHVV